MISRVLAVALTGVLMAGATPGSCADQVPAPDPVAFTALEVNGEVVGVPTAILTQVEARDLVPTREDLQGMERAIAMGELTIRFKGELSPAFHAWVSEGFSGDSRADLALVFVGTDNFEVGRITLTGSRLASLSRGVPGGEDDGTFTVKAQDHNSSRSNKTASVAFAPPDAGTGGGDAELEPEPEVDLAGLPEELADAVTVRAYTLRSCGNGTVCGSTSHFLVDPARTTDVERWFQGQAAADLSPQLTLTYRTLQGRVAARVSMALDPLTWHVASEGGTSPVYQATTVAGVNPIYDGP